MAGQIKKADRHCRAGMQAGRAEHAGRSEEACRQGRGIRQGRSERAGRQACRAGQAG
jgi:hypothetical protein